MLRDAFCVRSKAPFALFVLVQLGIFYDGLAPRIAGTVHPCAARLTLKKEKVTGELRAGCIGIASDAALGTHR